MSWLFILSSPRALQASHYKAESARGQVDTGKHRLGQATWPFLSSEGGLLPC